MAASLVALAALPVAFLVADVSGVRPLGGAVLAALAAAAVLLGRPPVGWAALWVVILLACFAASHALADPLGTWGAVALVAAVAGAAGAVLLNRPGSAPSARGTPPRRAAPDRS